MRIDSREFECGQADHDSSLSAPAAAASIFPPSGGKRCHAFENYSALRFGIDTEIEHVGRA